MPLIDCPDCGRAISTEAESCPQCGRPNRPAARAAGPTCYACPAPATTRCQKCGALSCVEHLKNIYVPHGHGGAYEFRCPECYESAQGWKTIGNIVFGVVVLIIVLVATKGCR